MLNMAKASSEMVSVTGEKGCGMAGSTRTENQWQQVILSDESKFKNFGSNCCHYATVSVYCNL